MFGDEVSVLQALQISAVSILIVFLVLLSISWLIRITAVIINRPAKKEIREVPAAEAPAEPAEEVRDDSDKFILAAAAVAAYLGTDRFVIRSIRKANEEGSWAARSRTGFLDE
ncbi:MAG: OadG family protein [Solobacterium sp.]|nr:OadG family protein [Solobacterium sp.]